MMTENCNNTTLNHQTEEKVEICVDYKDAKSLARYISERGKIIPSRVNNIPIKKQREISRAVKRARILAIVPFISDR